MGLDHKRNYNCRSHCLDLSSLVLDAACGQRRFLGMNGFLVNGGHYRIDLHSEGNGMEEEFPESKLGISFKCLAPFYSKLYMVVYTFSPQKTENHVKLKNGQTL